MSARLVLKRRASNDTLCTKYVEPGPSVDKKAKDPAPALFLLQHHQPLLIEQLKDSIKTMVLDWGPAQRRCYDG